MHACMYVETLQRANPPSKESYHIVQK
jgi:hypothetical protein